jgi:hypothetical protein
MGIDPDEDLSRSGKAKPIAPLSANVYLAKPLYYIREYESQQFAHATGYRPACCGCPACKYPSRRDIVEESLACALRGPLWEFDAPGIRSFLRRTAGSEVIDEVERKSAPGTETKHAHLPFEFFEYAASVFRTHAQTHRALLGYSSLSGGESLDYIGVRRLKHQTERCSPMRIPAPALFSDCPLSELQLRMIATLGPYWGAIGLAPRLASEAWQIQKQFFGFEVDSKWSQVAALLRSFYSGGTRHCEGQLIDIGRTRANRIATGSAASAGVS